MGGICTDSLIRDAFSVTSPAESKPFSIVHMLSRSKVLLEVQILGVITPHPCNCHYGIVAGLSLSPSLPVYKYIHTLSLYIYFIYTVSFPEVHFCAEIGLCIPWSFICKT